MIKKRHINSPLTKGVRGLFPLIKGGLRGLFFLLFLSGCVMLQEQGAPLATGLSGQFTLYLNGPERSLQDITFNLLSVSVMSEDGVYTELLDSPLNVRSTDIAGRQRLLSERYLPEGRYRKIRLLIKEATLRKKELSNLSIESEVVELDINFMMTRNQNTTLFIHWNADASVEEGFLFRPVFMVKKQVPELSTLLVYVANEESDNVSVINRQTGSVVGTVLVGRRPKGIATGTRREALKVYVANSGSNSISVIDPTTNRVETEIPLRFGWKPEDVAVMRVSNDKELIFVANYGSNTVSMVDLRTYQEMERIFVGSGPVAIAVDPPVEEMLSSRFLSHDDLNIISRYRDRFFNVYVANRNSRSISVIRVEIATNRPVEVVNLNVEWDPVEIVVDSQRAKVYVTNYESDKMSVVDIVQLIKGNRTGAVNAITGIGRSAVGVVVDSQMDKLYVLKELTGQILILKPAQEGILAGAVLPSVTGIIDVKGMPRAMAIDPESRKLYVVNRAANNVIVIDKFTHTEDKTIPVGKKPVSITMFPF